VTRIRAGMNLPAIDASACSWQAACGTNYLRTPSYLAARSRSRHGCRCLRTQQSPAACAASYDL
jgi:hypothetical protein